MNCPNCNVTLLMSEKQWVEIDYCPQCRGIWLDKWELEKLIQKEKTYEENMYQNPQPMPPKNDHWNKKYYNDDDNYSPQKWHHWKRKESFLGEIFDIF